LRARAEELSIPATGFETKPKTKRFEEKVEGSAVIQSKTLNHGRRGGFRKKKPKESRTTGLMGKENEERSLPERG